MNNLTFKNVHSEFKINNTLFCVQDILNMAVDLVKETEDHLMDMGNFILDWFDNKSYIKTMTSGTTGVPKQIMIQKQAMINSAITTGLFFDLKPNDRALHCLPCKFIAGKMMLVRAFVLGLNLDIVMSNSNPLYDNSIKYDFCAMIPLQVQNSLSQLGQIKILIIGGAKINKSLEEKLKTSHAYETYGMTESITHVAVRRVGLDKAFTILPTITIEQDERKCLVITAPNIRNEKIVTNDLVELISKDQFIWKGRFDNIINSGGVKLIPEQIEDKLNKKIKGRFYISSKADTNLGNKVVLVIEGKRYQIEDSVFEELDKYERPKEIIFVFNFELTETGKLKRIKFV